MTKRTGDDLGPAASKRRSVRTRTSQQSSTASGSALPEPRPQAIEDPLVLPTRSSYYARDDLDLGHMGCFSHSADLLEHREQLGAALAEPQSGLVAARESTSNGDDGLSESQLRMQRLSLAVLDCLPTAPLSRALAKASDNEDAYIGYLGATLIPFGNRFWDTHGLVFERPRRKDNLLALAELLCRNTREQLVVPSTNEEWLNSVCGFNSRWEYVGLLIVNTAAYTFNMSDSDPLLKMVVAGVAANRRDYVCKMLDCADACYQLCTTWLKQHNKLSVSLQVSATWLQSVVGGDSSFALWIRKGAACAGLTAFGMHEHRPEEESTQARAFSHDQRHIVSLAMTLDTMLATFTGRPPALSFRYVTCPSPYDIDITTALDDSISIKVDANGWALDGRITAGTRRRASSLAVERRQEILELSLGPDKENIHIESRLIREGLDASFASMPPLFRIEINRSSLNKHTPMTISAILNNKLIHLHSHFLLARIEHAYGLHSRFLEVAHEMLSLLNTFFNVRERLPGYSDELVWYVSSTPQVSS